MTPIRFAAACLLATPLAFAAAAAVTAWWSETRWLPRIAGPA